MLNEEGFYNCIKDGDSKLLKLIEVIVKLAKNNKETII